MKFAIQIDHTHKCAAVTRFRDGGKTRQERYFDLTGPSFRRLQRVCAGLQPLPVHGYSGPTGEVVYAHMGGAR